MKRSVVANGSSRTRINKQFILNTIDGLKSHNRREEEEDCWRQHRLEQDAHYRMTSSASGGRQDNLDGEVPNRPPIIHVDDERKFWAETKARAMTSLESAGPHTAPGEHAVDVESEIRSDIPNEHRKGKKRKRERQIEGGKWRRDEDGKGSSDEQRRFKKRKRERRTEESKLHYEDKKGGRPRDDSVEHKESDLKLRKRKKSKKHPKVERKKHKKKR